MIILGDYKSPYTPSLDRPLNGHQETFVILTTNRKLYVDWHRCCWPAVTFNSHCNIVQYVAQYIKWQFLLLYVTLIGCARKRIEPIFSERELTFTFAICYRPSVCRLSSATFVRPTQAVQIFGNISTALGTLAILWHLLKISWRSSQGNPSAGAVKHKRGSQVQRFWTYRRLHLGNGAR